MAERAGHQNEGDAIFMPAPVGHRTAALYGVGSIGTVIFIITPQILLLYVLTRILQVPAQWAGFALLAPKAIELALDPLIGAVSDRTTSRFGRRWPFMAIGALTFPFAFAALFAPPTFASWPLTLAWVTGIYVLATSAYTIFAVPYIALVGEIAASPAERLRLVAWRMGFVSIGVLIAGAGAPLIAGMSAGLRDRGGDACSPVFARRLGIDVGCLALSPSRRRAQRYADLRDSAQNLPDARLSRPVAELCRANGRRQCERRPAPVRSGISAAHQ